MIYQKLAEGTIDEVLARIEQAAKAEKFGVLCTHDLKQKMNAKGVEFSQACRVVEICNPAKAKMVLDVDLVIANALPCRIAVFEDDNGTVHVTLLRPTELIKLFGHSELDDAAREVEQSMVAIIDAACRAELASAE